MIRSLAVARVARGLGFRSGLDDTIVDALQEAQRDLEKGKTLPKFLLQEDEAFTLLTGASTVDLPTGFLRVEDTERPHFVGDTSDTPIFLTRKYLDDALVSQIRTDNTARAPSIYVVRQTVLDFIVTADVDYDFTWSYYKAADLLTSDIENAWLANASEWLIGEAGYRLAKDLRDAEAVTIFDGLRTAGRAAVFGEDIAAELADGGLVMGGEG